MPRLLLAALFVASVSACAPLGREYPQGAGFTGVGYERSAVAPGVASPSFSASRTAVTATAAPVAGVPVIRARTRSTRPSGQAEAAIRAGGSLDTNSAAVIIAGEPLRFSIVEAGGTRFAVLKKRQRLFDGTMSTRAASGFRGRIPELTGCQAGVGGYSYGPARGAAVGIAIPLICA